MRTAKKLLFHDKCHRVKKVTEMKTFTLGALGLLLLLVSGVLLQQSSEAQEAKDEAVLRHVVLFKFKEGATKEQIQGVEEAFRALPGKISEIKDFEWGTNNSPEPHSKGFTHCFLVTFASEEDRDAYLPHPAHKQFASNLGPILEDVTVIDYWAKD